MSNFGSWTLITSQARISELRAPLKRLIDTVGLSANPLVTLDYYLWQIQDLKSAPAVLTDWSEGEPCAVVYGAERRFLRVRTGIVTIGDPTGQGVAVASDAQRIDGLMRGIEKLLRHWRIHTVRLRIESSDDLAARLTAGLGESRGLLCYCLLRPVSVRLPLAGTFEDFLAGLGPATRQNFRRYGRRARSAGFRFRKDLSFSEAASALRYLQPRATHEISPSLVEADLAALASWQDSFTCGVVEPGGAWVSVAGGWRSGNLFFVLFQLNDAAYPRLSLSTVIRLHLIEELTRRGVHEIRFIRGCLGFWSQFCLPDRIVDLVVEKKHLLWNILNGCATRLFGRRFPIYSEMKAALSKGYSGSRSGIWNGNEVENDSQEPRARVLP